MPKYTVHNTLGFDRVQPYMPGDIVAMGEEEAVELIIEAKDNNIDLFKNEAADLVYSFIIKLVCIRHFSIFCNSLVYNILEFIYKPLRGLLSKTRFAAGVACRSCRIDSDEERVIVTIG